jgi:hypothetical protein
MVVTVRVDRVKGSAVDESSTIATVGPFGGGINLIRLNKNCEVHTHFYVQTPVAMKEPRSGVTGNESDYSLPEGVYVKCVLKLRIRKVVVSNVPDTIVNSCSLSNNPSTMPMYKS